MFLLDEHSWTKRSFQVKNTAALNAVVIAAKVQNSQNFVMIFLKDRGHQGDEGLNIKELLLAVQASKAE